MRALAVSLAVLLSTTAAQAADKYIWDKVSSINAGSRTITLSNNGRYNIAEGVDVDEILPGMMVEAFSQRKGSNNQIVFMMSEDQIDRTDQDFDDGDED